MSVMKSKGTTEPLAEGGEPVRMIDVEVTAGSAVGARLSSAGPITVGTDSANDLVLEDPAVSSFHLALERRGNRIRVTDRGSTNGTHAGPVHFEDGSIDVAPGASLTIGRTTLQLRDGTVIQRPYGPDRYGELQGRAPAMRRLFAELARVQDLDLPLLIGGESGTGKELVARAVHDASRRRQLPFQVLDCGAMTPSLFPSELFGHEQGAFTDAARRRPGVFELAGEGTLLLDEVGELGSEQQAMLLGVLERRSFRRIGGSVDLQVGCRVMAATHRDLAAAVNRGTFRLDLFHRLAVVRVTTPPLRERVTDIQIIIDSILRRLGAERTHRELFTEDQLRQLRAYWWPGNVRELRNVVVRAHSLGEVSFGVSATAAKAPPAPPTTSGPRPLSYREAKRQVVEAFERRYLSELLERTKGNQRRAAREAEMDRKYLLQLLERHGMR